MFKAAETFIAAGLQAVIDLYHYYSYINKRRQRNESQRHVTQGVIHVADAWEQIEERRETELEKAQRLVRREEERQQREADKASEKARKQAEREARKEERLQKQQQAQKRRLERAQESQRKRQRRESQVQSASSQLTQGSDSGGIPANLLYKFSLDSSSEQ